MSLQRKTPMNRSSNGLKRTGIKQAATTKRRPVNKAKQVSKPKPKTDHWPRIRLIVLDRDNHWCRRCNQAPAPEAHHVFQRSQFPEHRLNPDVCAALCLECHAHVHANIAESHADGWIAPLGATPDRFVIGTGWVV